MSVAKRSSENHYHASDTETAVWILVMTLLAVAGVAAIELIRRVG